MDTVVWNMNVADQRFAYSGTAQQDPSWGQNEASFSPQTYFPPFASYSQPNGLHTQHAARGRTPTSDMTRANSPQPEALAGQTYGENWIPHTVLQPPLASNLNLAPMGQVETPMISLRAASPSSKEPDSMALLGLFGSSPRGYAMPPSQNNPFLPAAQRGVTPNADDRLQSESLQSITSQEKENAQVLPFHQSFAHQPLGVANQFASQDVRRRDSAQLRGFLKLDVDMGFVSDGKNESPTMLQPTFGWKKRRSVSDVGPRTPSMLGPSGDHQIISPIDDMAFLMPDVQMPSSRDLQQPIYSASQQPNGNTQASSLIPSMDPSSAPDARGMQMDAALHFASLNLRVPEPGTNPVGNTQPTSTPSSPRSNSHEIHMPTINNASLDLPKNTSSSTDVNMLSSDQPASPVTLDPTLIQHAPQFVHSLSSIGTPLVNEANVAMEESTSHTGPIRPKPATRNVRSTSPYEAPHKSGTPDADMHAMMNDHELRNRMARWRFPVGNDASFADSLHPMDAYARTEQSPYEMRNSTHQRTRRHMRAAVSEDWQGRERNNTLVGNGCHSFDLSHEPMSPFASISLPHSAKANNRAVSPDMALWAATQESQKLLHAGSNATSPTLSDAAQSSRSSAQHVSPQSPNIGHTDEFHAVQTAAQTHTPVVTTSAAQAASAMRRKTEALFTCPFPDCGSTFTRQYNLRGHMRSHMDQRPFKCDWPGCGRSFARTHDCKRHHNLHLNIKPYSCESCGKTFARLDALNRHHKSEAGSCGPHDGRDSSNTPG
ncbi:hypothetical protein MPSI1_003455 [Malassezia psittaci]|uniref:C2H2-type domain-containing protein n=1 Tax=Malassezia psittaci TaxID=1821823 RepID=A0AAF0FDI8_9BASI|nr:hypothetical protein MPSI1_003455 [Malassezia psittaci]